MLGTVAAAVSRVVERATPSPSPLDDRLGGVDAGATLQTLRTEGTVRRRGPRVLEHVPTGRTFHSAQVLLFFQEGYARARSVEDEAPPSSITLVDGTTEAEFLHRPSGERFTSDLAVQTFEDGWEAGRRSPQ